MILKGTALKTQPPTEHFPTGSLEFYVHDQGNKCESKTHAAL